MLFFLLGINRWQYGVIGKSLIGAKLVLLVLVGQSPFLVYIQASSIQLEQILHSFLDVSLIFLHDKLNIYFLIVISWIAIQFFSSICVLTSLRRYARHKERRDAEKASFRSGAGGGRSGDNDGGCFSCGEAGAVLFNLLGFYPERKCFGVALLNRLLILYIIFKGSSRLVDSLIGATKALTSSPVGCERAEECSAMYWCHCC